MQAKITLCSRFPVLSSSLSSPAKDGSGLVESLIAQKEVKLVSWRKDFRRIPYKDPL